MVPPDLLATTNRVRSGSIAWSTAATAAGSTVSRTVRRGKPSRPENDSAATSGHRLLPPIPSSTTSRTSSPRTSSAKALRSGRSAIASVEPRVQPRRFAMESRVEASPGHSDGSRPARRTANRCSCSADRVAASPGTMSAGSRTATRRPSRISARRSASPARRASNGSTNFWAPSANNCSLTAGMSMPSADRSANTTSECASPCSTVSGTTCPAEANASIVTSGMVFTVSRPISGST